MTVTPRGEYPRPHFDRSHSWLSLNGSWDFAPDPELSGVPRGLPADTAAWPAEIVVPFAWETQASGVALHWMPCGWYRRRVEIPRRWAGERVILHFGAVHHRATLWINGIEIGTHEGGYTPFEFDVTPALSGEAAVVVVRVEAPINKREIVHGKQRSIPRDDYDGCSFTPSSGIWQSVWLEARPATYVRQVSLRPSIGLDAIVADIALAGPNVDGSRLRVAVVGSGLPPVEVVAQAQLQKLTFPIANPVLWQPHDPHLYDVHVKLVSADGNDSVVASTGLRSVAIEDGQVLLNGSRLYVRGVLDQGYWPSSGITAPSDEAFVTDLELARAAGYNVVRKHLKLEDPRFPYHADRLGMLIWAEPASTGIFTSDAVARFEAQIEPMVARDGNHPSIVIWGLYNEEWGLDWDVPGDAAKQDAVRHAVALLRELDQSRPLVDNSGWTHVDTDLVDWHIYDEQPSGWAAKVAALMSGRTDRFPVSIAVDKVVDKLLMAGGGPAPAGLPNLNSEYGGGYTSVERGWNLRWQTQELRRYDTLSGYIWTELYDIEHETAGIYTSERGKKDHGGNEPRAANAETVLVVSVTPESSGRDLLVASRDVEVRVQVSHHGVAPLQVRLSSAWGPPFGPLESAQVGTSRGSGVLDVKPFMLSEEAVVATRMPDDLTRARLHLLALADDRVVASTCVDVELAR
jgi:beta-galactosidase/beta-glucuronidase